MRCSAITSVFLAFCIQTARVAQHASNATQVELVVDDMRRSLTRRAGVDRRLPQFVGMTGFQDYAINVVVLVSPA